MRGKAEKKREKKKRKTINEGAEGRWGQMMRRAEEERGQNRRKARSRVEMTDSDRAEMWQWEVRVRQMETQIRRS